MLRLYSVYDKVSQLFGSPFTESNDAAAARSFEFAQKDNRSLIGISPADFTLFFVGEFDADTGDLIKPTAPVKVVDGKPKLDDFPGCNGDCESCEECD